MARRHEFVIKDLAIAIRPESGGGSGGTFLPAEDGEPLPWWISPIAAVLDKGLIIESVGRTITEVLDDNGDLGEIAEAFHGGPGGHPGVAAVIHEIGAAVVAAGTYTHVGGSVGYPNPDCGGTSLETIPPTITPVVHKGLEVHRVSQLPRLQRQLEIAVETLGGLSKQLLPQGDEVKVVSRHLEEAQRELGG